MNLILGTRKLALGAGMLVAVAVLGCGGEKLPVDDGVIVKMKIVKGGQPLSSPAAGGEPIPGADLVSPYQIKLVPQSSEGHKRGEYYGEYGPDGTTTFIGAGKGIPPGVYKLVITGSDVMPGTGEGDASEAASDPLQGRFMLQNTPFEFTVPGADVGKEHDFGTIDLDQPPK